MKIGKNYEILFQPINEWLQFFYAFKYNWKDFDFALIEIRFEDDKKMTGGAEIEIILLGFGFTIRFNYDFENSQLGQIIKKDKKLKKIFKKTPQPPKKYEK